MPVDYSEAIRGLARVTEGLCYGNRVIVHGFRVPSSVRLHLTNKSSQTSDENSLSFPFWRLVPGSNFDMRNLRRLLFVNTPENDDNHDAACLKSLVL